VEPKIVYEDESLLVLDKPAGVVVNRAKSVRGKTVQDWLEKYLKIRGWGIGGRAGIVHRLDKETSGILVVAKTEEAFKNLQAQFKARKVKKGYTALVHGRVEPEQGLVSAPVGRLPWRRERFGVLPGGRKAETEYKVSSYYQKESQDFSLLAVTPKTGRTHQIRIHLKYLRHPIVADEFYTGRKTARADRTWCPRLFLHAGTISFNHPKTQRRITLDSSLPQDLKKALRLLAKSS